MRRSALLFALLLPATLAAGCAPAATPPRAVQAAASAAVPEPPAAMGQVGLMDYMFGPPPRTRIAPQIRCPIRCPEGAASAPATANP